MVFRRIVKLDMVDGLVGGVTLVFWSRAKAWAERLRIQTGNPKSFERCEWLALSLATKLRPSGTQLGRNSGRNHRLMVMHVYEVRPRKDKRGVDLISDALPFGRLLLKSDQLFLGNFVSSVP
jgi:hypothetical protein